LGIESPLKTNFSAFQSYLLTAVYPDRYSADEIIKFCSVFTNICATLDTISSKVHMKFQEHGEQDHDILQKVLHNLDSLWKSAGSS
jgi:hypothetical protein